MATTWSNNVTDLGTTLTSQQLSIESLVAGLNSTAAAANTAKTYDTYNSSVTSYNSQLASYNSLVDEYGINADLYAVAQDEYTRSIQTSIAQTALIELPNYKDKFDHLPGGHFGFSGQMPGNAYWSATVSPEMAPGRVDVKNDVNLLNGNLLAYVGSGLNGITNLVNGGALNLMFDDDLRIVSVFNITVTATVIGTGQVVYNNSTTVQGNGEGTGVSDYATGNPMDTTEMSLDSVSKAWSNKTNLAAALAVGKLSLAISIVDVMTNEQLTTEEKIGSVAFGTVHGVFTSMISNAITGMTGFTGYAGLVTSAGITGIVGAILGELAEMALGLDNSFGFGGDYVGTNNITGETSFEKGRNVFEGFSDLAKGMFDSSYMSYSEVAANNFEAGMMLAEAEFMSQFNLSNTEMDDLQAAASIGTNNVNAAYSGINATLADFMSDMDSNFSSDSISSISSSPEEKSQAAFDSFKNVQGGFDSFGDAYGAHEAAAEAYGGSMW